MPRAQCSGARGYVPPGLEAGAAWSGGGAEERGFAGSCGAVPESDAGIAALLDEDAVVLGDGLGDVSNERVGDPAKAALVARSVHPGKVGELGVHADADDLQRGREAVRRHSNARQRGTAADEDVSDLTALLSPARSPATAHLNALSLEVLDAVREGNDLRLRKCDVDQVSPRFLGNPT